MQHKIYLCPECRSDNITLDASALWNPREEQWELQATYDEGWCNNCGTTNIDTNEFVESTIDLPPLN